MSGDSTSSELSKGIDPVVWRVAAVVCLGPFMTQMDSTVVNVSMSAIGGSLYAPIATVQWIISGYLLALALMLPLNGWLVDRIGAKRLYVWCFSVFTLASLLCGASRTMDQLICARVLQGMAGGILAPMAQMMIARVAGKHMARVMGYAVMPVLLAPILGPVLAGAILQHATWPWLFYLNLPVGIFGIGLALLLLPNDAASIQKRAFDLPGFLLISPGLACLLYGFQQAAHRNGAWTLCVGASFMSIFFWHAMRKGSAALIDLRVFNNRIFSAAAAAQFFFNSLMYGRQFLIPLYLITGCALSASQAGWMVASMGIGMMISFPMVGFLTERFGCRRVSAGGAWLALLSMLPFLWMIHSQFSPSWTVVSLFVAGIGQGTIGIPSISAAYGSVPKDKLPLANTALNIVQRLGGPLATTAIAIVISLTSPANPTHGTQPFMLVFVLLTAIHVLMLASASCLPLHMQRKNR